MNNQEALNTLKDIRKMMEKSSRFLSLNGSSAVIIGIYACIAALIAYFILGDSSLFPLYKIYISAKLQALFILAASLVTMSMITALLMCRRKAHKEHLQLQLDVTTKKLLWNFFLPLIVGGILCLSFISQQYYSIITSIMLIFYGISLINVSNYTYSNTRYLGYAEITLGLVNCFATSYSLLFWTCGFGIFHILYGVWFYWKIERKNE